VAAAARVSKALESSGTNAIAGSPLFAMALIIGAYSERSISIYDNSIWQI
jgi:hypothetical protein